MTAAMDPYRGIPEHNLGNYPEQGEVAAPVDYDTYRVLCDSEDNFHKVGILNEVGYEAAISDNRTLFLTMGEGSVPAIVPLEYEDGYDTERTAHLSEHSEPMLAAIPFSRMVDGSLDGSQLVGGEGLSRDFAIVVEQSGLDVHVSDGEREKAAAFLGKLGSLTVRDFIDERIAGVEGHESAWLSLYSFSFSASEQALERPTASDFDEAWIGYREEKGMSDMPDEKATGTYLFTPEQLQVHPEIVDSLWEISEFGFGKILGMHHPVSMEETKRTFQDQLFSDKSYTAVHFQEGEPICFGSLLFNVEDCDWLNVASTSLREQLVAAEQQQEVPVWFSEIISKGIHHSHKIFQLFLDMAGRTHKDYRVLYESSNFASTYIPAIANRQVERAESVELTRPSEQLDKMSYWYLEPQAPPEATAA